MKMSGNKLQIKTIALFQKLCEVQRLLLLIKRIIQNQNQKKIKTNSTQTMLLKFLKEKEEAKKRRHQEKMELIRSLLNK